MVVAAVVVLPGGLVLPASPSAPGQDVGGGVLDGQGERGDEMGGLGQGEPVELVVFGQVGERYLSTFTSQVFRLCS